MESKEVTLAVYIELSKAFDTICINTLKIKLQHYGIRGVALKGYHPILQKGTCMLD